MTNSLIKHIQDINAKTQAWLDESPETRGAGMLIEDLDHWNQYDIHTPEQLDHYLAACNNFETVRGLYGYKPSWARYDNMTTAEIEADTNAMVEREHGLAAVDAAAADKLAVELGHDVETLKRWGVV